MSRHTCRLTTLALATAPIVPYTPLVAAQSTQSVSNEQIDEDLIHELGANRVNDA